MITAFVKHKVDDFGIWKSVYDKFKSYAKEHGVVEESVYRDPNYPDDVIVTHKFENVKSANDFFNSGELRSAMKDAGVSSEPVIWFGEKVN